MNLMFYIIIGVIILLLLQILGFMMMVKQWRKKAKLGQALIRTSTKEIVVSFSHIWVLPIIHRLEILDISLKSMTLDFREKQGVICKDYLRADIKITFFIKIEQDEEAIKKIAQQIGVERAGTKEFLMDFFTAQFSEAIKSIAKEFEFAELYKQRNMFKKLLLQEIIKEDLGGYRIENFCIDSLEQTPIEFLDENNILDAQAIKKIKLSKGEKIKYRFIEVLFLRLYKAKIADIAGL